jgi:hypothetical protein
MAREATSCEEGWACAGGAGSVRLDPREDSNEKLIFKFQTNLDYG